MVALCLILGYIVAIGIVEVSRMLISSELKKSVMEELLLNVVLG